MDAGVGAAGAADGDRMLDDAGQGVFEGFLDGEDAAGLPLPAVVAAAVIGKGQLELTGVRRTFQGLIHKYRLRRILVEIPPYCKYCTEKSGKNNVSLD